MALGMLSLLGALWGGLLRVGWALPAVTPVAGFHGPLMVSGFLGTVIGLERAVALGRWWAYGAPLATGAGGILLILGVPGPAGPFLLVVGSVLLTGVFVAILRRDTALFTVVMALACVLWLVGQVLWLVGWPVYRVVGWWAAFLVLTIAGERLELSRLISLSPVRWRAFLGAVVLVVGGLAVSTVTDDLGMRVLGAGFVALSAWLARCDIARRTVRQQGLTRFIAVCLLAGYAWLAVGGVLALWLGAVAAGPGYDAILHAVFLGFVFSMIFGHAPIIFPAVLGIAVPYRPAFYAHVVLLHASLLVRIGADVAGSVPARQWGALLNVVALLLFVASTAASAGRALAPKRVPA